MTVSDAANIALAITNFALVIIAFGAAWVAFGQLQTIRRFELLKLLEEPRLREARRTLYRRLYKPMGAPPPEAWWTLEGQKDLEELEKAASDVCAAFDILGLMARGRNRKFFVKEWKFPICWTYGALEDYLRHRSPDGYRGYRSLYQEASKSPS